MAGRNRIVPMIAVAMFLLGLVVMMPGTGNAAGKNTVVTGIVGTSGETWSRWPGKRTT